MTDVPPAVQPRGRPPDPRRREATLAAATDHVLAHGLAGSNLRPLAAALGTSHRMLLYDFGTKEALLAAVLAEARRRLAELWRTEVRLADASPAEALRLAWEWMTDPVQEPYVRLFFEVQVDAMRRPEAYPDGGAAMVRDWLGPVAAMLAEREPGEREPGEREPGEREPGERAADERATLAVATLRGLLLDRLTTGDAERTDRAAARMSEQPPPAS